MTPSFFMFVLFLAVILTCADSAALPDRMPRSFRQHDGVDPKKRPFCNAFTGCGRKRSDAPAAAPQPEQDLDDSIASLLDLSAEPAVEDLSRQIMSEAKLWEAIQEASMEIVKQKQGQRSSDSFPISFSIQ